MNTSNRILSLETEILPLTTAIVALLCLLHPAYGQDWTAGPVRGPNGNYYEIVGYDTRTVSWDQAQVEAQARFESMQFGAHDSFGLHVYGHLATITDEQEDVFIERLRHEALAAAGIDPDHPPVAAVFWIGGSQNAGEAIVDQGWSWIRSEGALADGYSNWLPGEPNDSPSSTEDNEENYLSIGHRGQFGWNDRSAPARGYVVEYDVPARRNTYGPVQRSSGHYYEYVRGITFDWDWQEAAFLAGCRIHNNLGGHLATITSVEEDRFIDYHRQRALQEFGFNLREPGSLPAFWVGGFQPADERQVNQGWSWVNDEGPIPGLNTGADYANWLSGEPNDWPGVGVEDNQENGLAIGLSGQNGWNDEGFPTPGYVIEYDIPLDGSERYSSARYDGNGGSRYAFQTRFNRRPEMTVEAWVYREGASPWCETIISQGFSDSFWFGFCENQLRFYRSGGTSATVNVDVPIGQWTHVAASYNGTRVTFYVDGVSAGERALGNTGAGSTGPVFIACNDDGLVAAFQGSLDEVRLWSTPRSAAEIRTGLFTEVHQAEGLEAVWPDGANLADDRDLTFVGSPHELRRFGILPQKLLVPLAAVHPTFDGNVDLGTEYVGAEEVVLRYQDGPNFHDAVAYLVHTKEYLYVGIKGARLPPGGDPSPNNGIGLYLDTNGTTTAIATDMVRGEFFLADGLSGFSEVTELTIVNPFTGSTVTSFIWSTTEPHSYQFQFRLGTDRRGEINSVPDMEFRFHRDRLGNFDATALDRLAISHVATGGSIGNVWSPHGADANHPGTWAELRYLPFPAEQLPGASIRGTVVDSGTGRGIPGLEVSLRDYSQEVATATTVASGDFEFSNVLVPLGQTLSVLVHPPEGALTEPPTSRGDGIDPFRYGPTSVEFPACGSGSCTYSWIDFRLKLPLPPAELVGIEPDTFWPPVLVRTGNPTAGDVGKSTSTSSIRVHVSNAHELLNFYLVSRSCAAVDPISSPSCDLYEDYFPLEVVSRPSGESPFYELQIPNYYEQGHQEMAYPAFYKLAAHDTWLRPDNRPGQPSSWRYAPEAIWIQYPPYELVHGFPFQNIPDGHDIDDYRAAFYDQLGNPDPQRQLDFWAYFPIYLALTGDGECVGMVATSQRLFRGRGPMGIHIYRPLIPTGSSLYPRNRDVLFGNGFESLIGIPLPAGGHGPDLPELPARFDVINPFSPAPLNIWAQIRADHGVQFCTESIQSFLGQLVNPGGGVYITDMIAAVDRIRSRPLEFFICIRDGDKGHCVQPLRVMDLVVHGIPVPGMVRIEVYDPNLPGQRQDLDVDLMANRYTYTGAFPSTWSGQWLFVIETDPLYNNIRHVPPLSDLGQALAILGETSVEELLQFIIFGEAEPLAVSEDGGKLGWEADGTYVETGAQTIPLPVFNWLPANVPPLGHLSMPMYHRINNGAPEVKIHNRGPNYGLHATHDGSKMQLFVSGGVEGETDTVQFSQSDSLVTGLDFNSNQGRRSLEARITLRQTDGVFPAAVSLTAKDTSAMGMRILPGANGVQFLNDTGEEWHSEIKITLPGANNTPRSVRTPMLPVTAGSALSVRSPDGNNFEDLLFDLDRNRDGHPEQTMYFSFETGQFQPARPQLSIRWLGDQIEASWSNPDGFRLIVSKDLRQWEIVEDVLIEGPNAVYRFSLAPDSSAELFFQLEQVP